MFLMLPISSCVQRLNLLDLSMRVASVHYCKHCMATEVHTVSGQWECTVARRTRTQILTTLNANIKHRTSDPNP